MADEDFCLQALDALGTEGEAEEPKKISPPKSNKKGGFVVDSSGRPQPEDYLNGYMNMVKPTYKLIVGKFAHYCKSTLPKFANSVYETDYPSLAETYQELKNADGEIPREYREYTDLRMHANFLAVELFKIGKSRGRVIYSDAMDGLIMELIGKFSVGSVSNEPLDWLIFWYFLQTRILRNTTRLKVCDNFIFTS